MHQYRRFLLTFLFAFGIPVLIVSQVYPLIGDSLANRVANEGDYLESLRNNTEFGCLTVLSREPELLLIGNSGSYASWDMRQLESKTGLRVGGCMMGGATIETLELILDLISHLRHPPKHVILGSSIYTFLKPIAHVSQLTTQRNLLREARFPYEFWLKSFFKQLLHVRTYPFLLSEQEKAIKIHRAPLEASEDIIEKLIRSHPPASLETVSRLNSAQRLDDRGAATVARICSKTEKIGAMLWVINIPTSPKAESIYTDDLWNYYQAALNRFDLCAKKVIRLRAADYGLTNRHYVNRMLDKYPYEDWLSGKSDDLHFDVDHPNPLGAERFTQSAICLIFGDEDSDATQNACNRQ
jgi:hypothetical protein